MEALVERKVSRKRWIIGALAAGVLGTLFLKIFIIQAFYVPSGSMKDTFQISDWFVVSRVGNQINRGDIVVFYDTAGWMAETESDQTVRKDPLNRFLRMNGIIPSRHNEVMVKRIIGMPGDSVMCCNAFRQIKVNGVPIDEPYLADGIAPSSIRFDVVVPDDALFLLGDNRPYSADSRRYLNHVSGGFVLKDDVIGRAIATIWPPSNATFHSTPDTGYLDAAKLTE
ncbi:MAG: signal peptidase I [Promicromonosporaceae bacterium]|nr:signal peptidase I [Promicromonosporaceae bacterium]